MANYLPRSTVYNGLLQRFQGSSIIGTVPADGARYGIITGSAAEYARFGTAMAYHESGFNTGSTNLSDPGGSFGLFQYAHNQVPGGNAYDPNASMDAFVRDTSSAVANSGNLNGGILGARFAQTTFGRSAGDLSGAGSLADGTDTNNSDSATGFRPGSTEAAPQGGAADPNADTQAGGEAAPAGGANPNDPNAGNGTATADGAASGKTAGNGGAASAAGAAGGQAIPIDLQILGPGTTKPITGWVDQIMKGFGQEAQNITNTAQKTATEYFSNLLGGISNWFVRAFVILLGIIILGIGLVMLMWDHGGEQVAINLRKAVRA